ncbi:type 1 fimbria pilin [Buttiauxella sp. JUb87]|jgi:type 1 fimbria pilin|uniref:fimbrial protein n=1 Tax=Buttiauxella sp. JUb87 TaxID=2485129 RepID=UPI0010F15E75|nr:fimbrial protein [Buttiauxella sp. JUb87]TDN49460.1 type 1 fimbria pilin [Buttiauxella sp. JUb87]
MQKKSVYRAMLTLLLGLSWPVESSFPFSAESRFFTETEDGEKVWMHGQTRFSGQVLAAACSLAMEDAWQSIDMGMLPVRNIQVNTSGPEVIFFLRLENCGLLKTNKGTFTGSPVFVTFDGVRGQQPDRFGLTGQAQGVELRIQDNQGYTAYVGEVMPPQSLTGNGQQLHYTLQLVRNGKTLQAGDYYAVVRMKMEYE